MFWKRTTCGTSIAMLVALCWPAPAQQDLLFSDTFSTRQGERPQSWTVVAAPTPRFWFVENNQLASGPGEDLGGDGNCYAVISAPGAEGWTDCSVSTQFWMRSRSGRVILVNRWRDARNHYEAYIQVFRDTRSAFIDIVRDGNRKTLAYGVGGVGLDIPSIENGSPDRRHTLHFTIVGTAMALYLDGVRLVEASDASLDRGSAGVGVQYSTAYFDNVLVERVKIIGPTTPVVRSVGPEAAGTGQVYRLLMGTFNSPAEAKRFQGELVGDGYLNVSVEPAGQKWDVLAGAFMSETEALQERANLGAQGVVVPGVVVRTGGTTQYTPVARRRPSAPDRVFTVRLGPWGTREGADALKRKLELDGFFGSEIRQEGTSFTVVLGSFRSREDADKYRRLLESSNYTVLEITEGKIAEAPGPALVTPTQVTLAIRQSEIWQTLTAEQKKEFERLMQAPAAAGVDQTPLYMDIKKEVEKLRLETRQKIADLVNNLEKSETSQRQLTALISKANKLAAGGNFAEARKSLDEIYAIDPDNNMARAIQQLIEVREKTAGMDRRLTDGPRQELERNLALARQRAEDYERNGYFQNALLEYKTLLSLLSEHNLDPQAQANYRDKIKALETAVALGNKSINDQFTTITARVRGLSSGLTGVQNEQGALKSSFEQKLEYLPYALGAFGLLALLTIWVLFGVRSVRRRHRLLLEQMQSLTLKPMMEISGGGAAVLPSQKPTREIGGAAPPVLEGKPSAAADLFPETPSPEPAFSFFEAKETMRPTKAPAAVEEPEPSVTMRLPEESPLPGPTVVGGASEEEEISSLFGSIPTRAGRTAKMPTPPPSPVGVAAGDEEEMGMDRMDQVVRVPSGGLPHFTDVEPEVAPLRLDEMVMESEIKVTPEAPGPPVEAVTAPLDLDMMGVGLPEQEAPPAAAAVSAGVFFEQSFDAEAEGAMPGKWQGSQESYAFASLKVASATPAPRSTRYLRFGKTEGVGSAYYSCRFPDATGQVAIEFDLRCDEKNKFLLGFYVEKDGDFRQSIHTIVHQPEAKGTASLRVQGEAVPYEMGSWRHIKYIVNLSTGRLSGYVDGETVLDNIRLTNCPRSLNTLSIRDNIPTTGVLLIDNIRIGRA